MEVIPHSIPPLLGCPTLLAGAISFGRSSTSQTRRHAMRTACSPSAAAALRFVMPESGYGPAEAAQHRDVLLVPVPVAHEKVLGKLLLQNAFLRYSVRLPPCVRFVARADDDSLVNLTAVARLLRTTHTALGEHWDLVCAPQPSHQTRAASS